MGFILRVYDNTERLENIVKERVKKAVYASVLALGLTLGATIPVPTAIATAYTVIKVHDGDTVTVQDKTSGIVTVRLLGIDAPELAQKPYGVESRDALRLMVLDKTVKLKYEHTKIDLHGRTLAYLISTRGKNLNVEMVRQGNAVQYMVAKYFSTRQALIDATNEAKAKHNGVFYKQLPYVALSEMPEAFRKRMRPVAK